MTEMYSLFKLVRLFSVKDEINSVTITCSAWRQHGEMSLLALACSNGFLMLRHSSNGRPPTIKQLPWPPDHPIVSLCFDPTVSWLLVLTDNGSLFIIPALSLLVPFAQVNQQWKLDDVTVISCLKPRGLPTYVVWWQTLDGQPVAIVTTKLGEILFVDLLQQCKLAQRSVDEHIRSADILQDNGQTITALLLTGYSGKQWRMQLEVRVAAVSHQDNELSVLGYDDLDGMSLPVRSVLNVFGDEEVDTFAPLSLPHFSRSVILSPQYAKGRHFVTAYCTKSSTLEVFDSSLEHNPLFEYKLPFVSMCNILTDRIMFITNKVDGNQKLMVLSNRLAEISKDSNQDFNKEAVLQQFDLPADENLLSVRAKSYPFYWHEKLEEDQLKFEHEHDEGLQSGVETEISALQVPWHSHTVLDGCIIVTDRCVYECQPRVSPERLFLELCVCHFDTLLIEQLGISLGLDLNFIFETAADFLLSHGNIQQATHLFHMSKGSPMSRISTFAKHGYVQEILPFLLQLLKKNTELPTTENKQLVQLCLCGLVHVVSLEPGNQDAANTLREFLLHFVDLDDTQKTAIELLSEAGLYSVLLEFAMAKGLIIEALETLSNKGRYILSDETIDRLLSKGFASYLVQAAAGAFFHVLDVNRLIQIYTEQPQVAIQHPEHLLGNLSDLDLGTLLHLAEAFDPSKPLVRGFLLRKLHRRRKSSHTSLTGSGDFKESTVRKDMTKVMEASRLVYCFWMIIIHLNHRRRQQGEPVNSEFLFTNLEQFVQKFNANSQQLRQKLRIKPSPIGCGATHAAAVVNGDLFTWGKSTAGRLGHGESKQSPAVLGPCPVGIFHTLHLGVISVACGMEHTLALTENGIYAWGSSKYGQVGQNTKLAYLRPMLIEELSKVQCVTVDCGQYHSMALTEDGQVYTWGWGVHGQLGHGDTEERLVPKVISSFSNQTITKVAAGYCHSLALNSQGELYAFGNGVFGQLGLGTGYKITIPVKIDSFTESIITMATRYFHSLAVTVRNKVYKWGCHPHGLRHFVQSHRHGRNGGQSVYEQVDEHMTPKLVDTGNCHGKIVQVSCGSHHCCIITTEGEIYTWGRNLDGQLGNGTRTDVQIPQQVTTINDKHIVHLSSGGEFNVAMDKDKQFWVWGRNEFGQLGIQAVDQHMSSKVIKIAGTKTNNQNVTEVLTPVPLYLTSSSPSSWQQRSLLETVCVSGSAESLNSIVGDDEDQDYENCIFNIPNICEVDSVPYNRIVLSVLLQCVPNFCDCNQLLQNCIDIKDWCLAASICIYIKHFTQALAYHLMSLRDNRMTDDNETFLYMSIKTVSHYYRLVQNNDQTPSSFEEDKKNVLYQVLLHWELENLSVLELEQFFESILEDNACILATILFRKSSTSNGKSGEDKPMLFNPSQQLVSKFSTKFCLRVTAIVLQKLQVSSKSSQSSSLNVLKQLAGNDFQLQVQSSLTGDKLPYDHLWQDIMQNLQKGHDTRKYIYITHNELDRLDQQFRQPENSSQVQTTLAVLFTCGHYYTMTSFSKELERMNNDKSFGNIKLPETVSVIKGYYSKQDCIPLACPRCVIGALAAISS